MSTDNDVKKRAAPAHTDSKNSKKSTLLSPCREKNTKLRRRLQHLDPAQRALRVTVQQCCASNDLRTALRAYEQAVQQHVPVEALVFYHLLHLLCSDSDGRRPVHVGMPVAARQKQREQLQHGQATNDNVNDNGQMESVLSLKERLAYATSLKAAMDATHLPLNDTAYTALVRLHAQAGQLKAAVALLDEAEAAAPHHCKLRLRLYLPVLVAYGSSPQGSDSRHVLMAALRLWRRILAHHLTLTEREYAALLRCATQANSAVVVRAILVRVMQDVLVPGSELRRALVAWYQGERRDSETAGERAVQALLSQLPDTENSNNHNYDGTIPVQSATGWTMSTNVAIDANGTLLSGCLQDSRLRPVAVSRTAWQHMLDMNKTIILHGKLPDDASQFQGGGKGVKRDMSERDRERRQQYWQQFDAFLQRLLANGPLDYVIDGANVGYYEQNFTEAPRHVDYTRIDWLCQTLQAQGRRVLIVLHSRHFASHIMPVSYAPMVQRWKDDGCLYASPPGMNDDWFWMQAALASGPPTSRDNDGCHHVGTYVVTNDEMRDHQFQMLAPRSLLWWKERHQVRFTSAAIWNDESGPRPLVLHYPPLYSRRMQVVDNGLVIPMPCVKDDLVDPATMEMASEEEWYLCIRPVAERLLDPEAADATK